LIVEWNGLPSVHKITAGQQIALYMSSAAEPAPSAGSVTARGEVNPSVTVLSESKKRKLDGAPQQDSYTWYLVRNGDSLWTISRKFNTSPDRIKRWNNLKSNLIHPGSRLKLITDA
jgi:membrane-bound lytic murein transglycosylase D